MTNRVQFTSRVKNYAIVSCKDEREAREIVSKYASKVWRVYKVMDWETRGFSYTVQRQDRENIDAFIDLEAEQSMFFVSFRDKDVSKVAEHLPVIELYPNEYCDIKCIGWSAKYLQEQEDARKRREEEKKRREEERIKCEQEFKMRPFTLDDLFGDMFNN